MGTKKDESLIWNKNFLAWCCFLETVYGVISMLFIVVLNELANTASSARDVGQLFSSGVVTTLIGLFYPASRAVADSVTQAYGERAAKAMRDRLNQAIFSMNNASFSEKDTGDYLNTLTGDVLLLRDQYYTQVPLIWGYISQFVFCVIYSIILNPIVGAVLMSISVIQYFVPMAFGRRLDQLMAVQSQRSADFTSRAKEFLLGFSVVKSYGGEEHIQREFGAANQGMAQAREKTAVMNQFMMCTNLLIALTMVLLSVLTASWFVMEGTMTPATLLTVFYIANRYSAPIMDLAKVYTQIKGSRSIREKLRIFLAAHPKVMEEEIVPVRRGINVVHLGFSYHQGSPALHDFTFSFEMGKKYLILGESGCGKSTLLKVLSGLYPSRGVYVDGKALENFSVGQLAGRLILVGQQPYIFRRSIAANIDFLEKGDPQRLEEVVKKCCLTDLIASLPQGADTFVDEEQRQLSGGQKARIGLARAIFTQPDILLLDEVTSALDPKTACKIERMLLELKNVLVIYVSHKPTPALLEQCDVVLTMEKGRLVGTKARPDEI